MKFSDVRKTMAMNRSLDEMSSLPFLIKKDDKEAISWFNYSINKKDDKVISDVSRILYTADGKDAVSEYSVISTELQPSEAGNPELTEKEYYKKLEELYAEKNYEGMIELLSSIVIEPLMEVYKLVIEYISEYEKSEETIEE